MRKAASPGTKRSSAGRVVTSSNAVAHLLAVVMGEAGRDQVGQLWVVGAVHEQLEGALADLGPLVAETRPQAVQARVLVARAGDQDLPPDACVGALPEALLVLHPLFLAQARKGVDQVSPGWSSRVQYSLSGSSFPYSFWKGDG